MIPNIRINPALYAGFCFIQGDAYTYSYRKYKLDEKKFALRPQLSIAIFSTKYLSLNFGTSYIFIPELKFDCPAVCKQDLSLNFNGISFFTTISFRLSDFLESSK
jgi:hypothetical protein